MKNTFLAPYVTHQSAERLDKTKGPKSSQENEDKKTCQRVAHKQKDKTHDNGNGFWYIHEVFPLKGRRKEKEKKKKKRKKKRSIYI